MVGKFFATRIVTGYPCSQLPHVHFENFWSAHMFSRLNETMKIGGATNYFTFNCSVKLFYPV